MSISTCPLARCGYTLGSGVSIFLGLLPSETFPSPNPGNKLGLYVSSKSAHPLAFLEVPGLELWADFFFFLSLFLLFRFKPGENGRLGGRAGPKWLPLPPCLLLAGKDKEFTFVTSLQNHNS